MTNRLAGYVAAGLATAAVLAGCTGAESTPSRSPSPSPSPTAAGGFCGVLPVDVVGRLLPGSPSELRAFGRPPKHANAFFDCQVVRHGAASHSIRVRIGDEATMAAIGQGQVVKPAIDAPQQLPPEIGEGQFDGQGSWVYADCGQRRLFGSVTRDGDDPDAPDAVLAVTRVMVDRMRENLNC